MAKQKFIIDVDVVIKNYNERNPNNKMSRKSLAETMDVNIQIFSEWKKGRTPKVTFMIMKLIEIGECDINEFINKV